MPYKIKKRPLRLLKDKNKLPYIKYKGKDISLKGYNIDEIIKIINKLTKQIKKKKLLPEEKKAKKSKISGYISGLITSTMGSSGQVVESRLKEDTEKINELKKENDILKTAVIVGNKGINENESTIKAIEQAKEQLAIEFKSLQQENKELQKYVSLKKKDLKDLIYYDVDKNQYELKTSKYTFSGNIDNIKQEIDNYVTNNFMKQKELNERIELLNEKQMKMESDQQELTTKLKLAEREFKKNELEKQRLEKEADRLGLKNIELEKQSKRQQIIKELETNKLQNEISKINTEKNILDDDKKKLNELMSKLNNDYEQVKKDKKITEDEKNKILREKEKLKFIASGLSKTSKKIETIKMENKIPATTNFNTKYEIYDFIYNRDNPILEQIQIKEQEQEPEPQQEGDGKMRGGLWTNQINKIMQANKYYIDTIAADEIDDIINYIEKNKILRGCFIMNTLKSTDKGVGHWVAVYYDVRPDGEYTCEYYDPFGENPKDNNLIKKLKKMFENMQIDAYVKCKINQVKQQSISSSNCGWYCIKFILERINDISFKEATKYKKIGQNEQDIKQIKKNYNKYGFI